MIEKRYSIWHYGIILHGRNIAFWIYIHQCASCSVHHLHGDFSCWISHGYSVTICSFTERVVSMTSGECIKLGCIGAVNANSVCKVLIIDIGGGESVCWVSSTLSSDGDGMVPEICSGVIIHIPELSKPFRCERRAVTAVKAGGGLLFRV